MQLFFSATGQGPLITVDVTPTASYLRHNPQGVAASKKVTVQFLLDTGATNCLIDAALIHGWGIQPTGAGKMIHHSNGAPFQSNDYPLSLHLYSGDPARGWTLPAVAIATAPSGHWNGWMFRGLIGRDVLNRARFVYDGRNSNVVLAW